MFGSRDVENMQLSNAQNVYKTIVHFKNNEELSVEKSNRDYYCRLKTDGRLFLEGTVCDTQSTMTEAVKKAINFCYLFEQPKISWIREIQK